MNAIHTTRGLTLIELIVAISVLAVLLVLAVPSLQEVIKNNRVTAQSNELVAMINLARNEAIRRNVDGEIRRSVVRFAVNGSTWTANVSVTDGEAQEGCPPDVIRCAAHSNVRLITDELEIIPFNRRGYISGAVDGELPSGVTLYLEHDLCKGQRQRRRIDILPGGLVRSCSLACGSEDTCDS